MPGNTVKINNKGEMSWYVGDSKIDELIGWLYAQGIKNQPEEEVETNANEVFNLGQLPRAKTKMDRLYEWLKQLIFPGDTSEFIQVIGVEEPADTEITMKFYLYTSEHKYMFVAIDRKDDKGYLGCQVSTRKQRAGEDWFRGNDLADGPFNKDTWVNILNSIIRYEIVKLTTYIRPEETPEISKFTPDDIGD